MEKVMSYLTRKNLLLGSFINGLLAVLTGLLFWIMKSSISVNLSDLQSALASLQSTLTFIKILCFLFYLHVILLFVLSAGYGCRIFYFKDPLLSMKLLGGSALLSLLAGLFTFSIVHALHQLTNANWLGIAAFANFNPDTFVMWMLLLLISGAFNCGFSAYLLFIAKSEEFDSAKAKESLEQFSSSAKEKMTKTGGSVGEKASDLSEKFKSYYATKKGKKTVFISLGVIGALILSVIGFNIYQSVKKTPIDLTSNCSVSFDGVSGEGHANIDCTPDYDINDETMPKFLQTVNWSVKNNGTLSNGDSVVLKASYSEATAKGSKIKVVNPEKKLKVEGLEEVYRKFADIPKEISSQFEPLASKMIAKYVQAGNGIWKPDQITIDSTDLVASYYKYDQYDHSGNAYYLYRIKKTEEDETSINTTYDYYYIIFGPLNTREPLDLHETDDIDYYTIMDVPFYSDEKTDAYAIQQMKSWYSDLETISEHPSSETFRDVEKEDKAKDTDNGNEAEEGNTEDQTEKEN